MCDSDDRGVASCQFHLDSDPRSKFQAPTQKQWLHHGIRALGLFVEPYKT